MYIMEYAIRNDKYPPPFASTWMELEGITLSEVSQSEKDIQYMVIHLGNIKIVIGNKGERRKNKWEISERETEHKRFLTLGNKLGVVEGEVGGGWR